MLDEHSTRFDQIEELLTSIEQILKRLDSLASTP